MTARSSLISYFLFPLGLMLHDVGERLLTHASSTPSRKVMGRTLTIIDASIKDRQHNKAVKDLIRGIFSDEMEFAADMCFDQQKLQALIPRGHQA